MTPDATRRRAIGQILLLAAGFLVLVAISTASVLLVNQTRSDNAGIVRAVEVEGMISTLLLQIRRAESSARAYFMTSDPQLLADHEAAVATILPNLEELARSTSDNPAQAQNIKQLRSSVEVRLQEFARFVDFIKGNDKASALAMARDVATGPTV